MDDIQLENILEPLDSYNKPFNDRDSFDSHILTFKTNTPAISVIIPLYNAEKYLKECLNSLLAQTFQDFELIIVDDCSTDKSCDIVNKYMPQFDGRLKLYHTEKNSGSGAIARNIGFSYSRGEYIYNMDNDDMLTKTALEELYTLAKEYDADVVYCEKYYMSSGVGKDFIKNIHLADKKIQKPPFVDIPTFEPDDLSERLQEVLDNRFWVAPWLKLIRRDLLDKNKLFFPALSIGDDDIWTYALIFMAKRFLRVPNMVYVRRMREDSISGKKNTFQQTVKLWLNPVLLGLKELDNFMGNVQFFQENPQQRYAILEKFFQGKLRLCFLNAGQISPNEVYETIKNEFGKHFNENDVVISALCTHISKQHKSLATKDKKIENVDEVTRKAKLRIAEQEAEIKQLKDKIDFISSFQVVQSICPKISVIIPMYNVEKYIGECLDSLLAQTFKEFEVIVVDDCSTDGSSAIIESYIPKFEGRLQIFKLDKKSEGGGGSLPRKKGLELSCGKYVFFLDADDTITATGFEELYEIAEKFNADVVHCEKFYRVLDKIWNDEKERSKLKADNYFTPGRLNVTSPTPLSDNIAKRVKIFAEKKLIWNFWAQLVRRDFILENEIQFPDAAAQDMLFTMCSLCCAKNYVVVPNVINFYRRRENSVTTEKIDYVTRLHKWLNVIRVDIKYLNDFFAKHKELVARSELKYILFDTLIKQMLPGLDAVYKNLSIPALDEILQKEFGDGDNTALMTFVFSTMNTYRLQMDKIPQSMFLPENTFANRNAISVIIPLYNAEKYIGECLNSLLVQTFKDFEVIVVDDCSTDKSVEVVENYVPKFNGRLRIAKMRKNTGSPGDPGNLGVSLSRGEYLFIMDNDDTITPDALEKLYKVAENFDADVVTVEKFYWVPEESWYDTDFRKNLKPTSYQTGGVFVSEPTLVPFDVAQRVQDCYDKKFLLSLWHKLIRRDFLIENEIRFQNTLIQDMIATYCLVCTAKRLVRVPYVINFYRVSKSSLYRQKREPLEQFRIYMNALNIGFKYLDNFFGKIEFFQKNPNNKQIILNAYLKEIWNEKVREVYDKISSIERDEVLRKEFVGEDNRGLTAFLFYISSELTTPLRDVKKIPAPKTSESKKPSQKTSDKFDPDLTARFDIKMTSKKDLKDFQIVSMSDDKAKIQQPEWMNKNAIGYQVHSYAGKLELVVKSASNGKITCFLRGLDIRDPKDYSKRIPHWIDYTRFIVDGKTIFDTVTPTWHDEFFYYKMNVKADKEIKIQLEWSPHKSKT